MLRRTAAATTARLASSDKSSKGDASRAKRSSKAPAKPVKRAGAPATKPLAKPVAKPPAKAGAARGRVGGAAAKATEAAKPSRAQKPTSAPKPNGAAKPEAPGKVAAPTPPAGAPVATPVAAAPVAPVVKPSTPPPPYGNRMHGGFRSSGGHGFALANGITISPMPIAPHVDFKVGDKAVHPAHGVGEVMAIEQRDIGGSKQMFYVLRILDNGMKVMVPTGAASQVGLRVIMSDKEASAILATMRAREVAVDVQPWSRRFRVYTEMIKSGSPVEVAKVLRDMNRLKFDKDLSFGERRLLDQARSLLLKELAFAKKKSEAEMAEEIRLIFSA
jgi:CarD family transcriptional regulator